MIGELLRWCGVIIYLSVSLGSQSPITKDSTNVTEGDLARYFSDI